MTGPGQGVTVYEAINNERREIYVALTTRPVFQILNELRRDTPPALGGWNLESEVNIRSVEFSLDADDARRFIDNYLRTVLPAGWRFLA